MTLQLPNMTWLRTFEAVARHQSFTGAGDELGLTQAAVSTQVKGLETQLGCPLFHRTTRRIALTDMGKAYLPAVRKAIEELTISTHGLFDVSSRKTVTVRAPISTAVFLIAPRLAVFQEQHPGIQVRLISEIWTPEADDARVDVEIKIGDAASDQRNAEVLFEDTVVPICAPSSAPRLQSPGDVLREPLIHTLGYEAHWPTYRSQVGYREETANSFTVDTSLAAVELAAAGAGIALVLKRIAQFLALSGRTSIVGDIQLPVLYRHYFAVPNSPRVERPEVQIFKSWLRAAFS